MRRARSPNTETHVSSTSYRERVFPCCTISLLTTNLCNFLHTASRLLVVFALWGFVLQIDETSRESARQDHFLTRLLPVVEWNFCLRCELSDPMGVVFFFPLHSLHTPRVSPRVLCIFKKNLKRAPTVAAGKHTSTLKIQIGPHASLCSEGFPLSAARVPVGSARQQAIDMQHRLAFVPCSAGSRHGAASESNPRLFLLYNI